MAGGGSGVSKDSLGKRLPSLLLAGKKEPQAEKRLRGPLYLSELLEAVGCGLELKEGEALELFWSILRLAFFQT